MNTITEDEFYRIYKPIPAPDGSDVWDHNVYPQVTRTDQSHLWTFCSGDGDYAVNGYAFVNRIGYMVTEVRWQIGQSITVIFDGPTCDLCGEPEDQDPTNGREYDWNGETGNHLSCEAGR